MHCKHSNSVIHLIEKVLADLPAKSSIYLQVLTDNMNFPSCENLELRIVAIFLGSVTKSLKTFFKL